MEHDPRGFHAVAVDCDEIWNTRKKKCRWFVNHLEPSRLLPWMWTWWGHKFYYCKVITPIFHRLMAAACETCLSEQRNCWPCRYEPRKRPILGDRSRQMDMHRRRMLKFFFYQRNFYELWFLYYIIKKWNKITVMRGKIKQVKRYLHFDVLPTGTW